MRIILLIALLVFQTQAATVSINQYAFASGSTLNNGLVAHWAMEQPTGTRLDSEPTGTPQDLTDNNTVGQVGGIQGNAAFFQAINSEFLSHADSADLSVGNIDFTITAWFKFSTLATSQSIVSHYNAAGNLRAWDVRWDSTSGRLQWIVSNNGTTLTTRELTAFGSPSTNVWLFIYCTHDSTADTISASINDGVVNSSAHATGVLNSSAIFTIGANDNTSRFFDGAIDEVSFWKRLLTTAEITELYAGGVGKFCCPY